MDLPTNEERVSDKEQALLPSKLVPLLSGHSYVVKPWGLSLGMQLNPRCMALVGALDGNYDPKNIAGMIRIAQVEVHDIVRLTLGWTPEEMEERMQYEDLLTMAQAVIEVCLMRGADLGGVLGKAVALGVLAQSQLKNVESDSSKPSTSSSQPATPGATSKITPPSK